jgi:hypothetical protein
MSDEPKPEEAAAPCFVSPAWFLGLAAPVPEGEPEEPPAEADEGGEA